MTKVMGGPAQPVKVVTSGKRVGGPARRVYGYAAAPTDGRKALGGPAQPVVVITDADLKENGGFYTLDGQTYAMPVFTAPAGAKVVGGPAIPVYPVNAWPTAAAAPLIVSTLLTGLVACWTLQEASGNATDSVGASTLVDSGTVGRAAGPSVAIPYARTFDGSNELKCASNAALQVGTSFTLAGWHYSNAGAVGAFASKIGGDANEYFISDTGSLTRTLYYYGTASGTLTDPTETPVQTWHAVRCGYNGASGKWFVQVDSNALVEVAAAGPNQSNGQFCLGSGNAWRYFSGRLAAWCKWSRVLTDAEWLEFQNGGSGKLYPFDLTPVGELQMFNLSNNAVIQRE